MEPADASHGFTTWETSAVSRCDEHNDPIGVATEAEWTAAANLLFPTDASNVDGDGRDKLLALLACDEAARERLIVQRAGAEVVGAIWADLPQGAAVICSIPRFVAGVSAAQSVEMIRRLVSIAGVQGAKLAQVLVMSSGDAAPFADAGFQPLAEMLFVELSPRRLHSQIQSERAIRRETKRESLEFVDATQFDDERMLSILRSTYEESLDCPELNELWDDRDALAGYRGVGDERSWLIVRCNGRDIGCLMLSRHGTEAAELVYLGLEPSVRGLKYGTQLLDQAMSICRNWGVERCIAAVDAGNVPALKTYAKAGFQVSAKRTAWVKSLR